MVWVVLASRPSIIHHHGILWPFVLMFESLSHEFIGNSLKLWLIAMLATFVFWFLLTIVRQIAAVATSKIADKTGLFWNRIVAKCVPRTRSFFLVALAIFGGSRLLDLSSRTDTFIHHAVIILGLLQLGLWTSHAVSLFVQDIREKSLEKNPAAVTSIGAIGLLARSLVWILVALLILANANVEIAPLLAGLGVGGLAVALAVQTVLKDLLASLSIILDKPFVVGDFLIIGDLMGGVEHIGLKTTRIRSLSGEQLVFSNNDLLESRIRNFGRMKERRVDFTIGVTYQTPRDKLVKIPDIIREAILAQKGTRFDRSHFQQFGDFSLDFETIYFVSVPDFNTYMDIQQGINLRIHESFEREGIEFAYPTQTLFLERPPISACTKPSGV